MKKKIDKINDLLISYFGIPFRAKKLPDPTDTLIATILSQNTNDKNSFQAFTNLKKKFKFWQDLAMATQKSIENIIRVAGLGKQKSGTIKNLLELMTEKNGKYDLSHLSEMDDDKIIDELTSINGIGVKTASCVLLFSFGRNVCPVDTHVHRTLNRIGLVKTNSPEKTFYLINEHLPDGIAHQFHTNLIKLGREICKPGKPNCSICPLLKNCKFEQKNFTLSKGIRQNSFLLLDSI